MLKPGKYRLTCTIANHDDLGQYGELKVVGSGHGTRPTQPAGLSSDPTPAPTSNGRCSAAHAIALDTAATGRRPGP